MAKKKEIETEFPWERQPSEGIKAYEAFNTYLLMGEDRTYTKVATELKKSTTIIGRWGSQYKWQERVAAYDAHQMELTRKDQAKAIREMRKRHALLATSMLTKVTKKMTKMSEDELTPQDMKAWVDVATKLERLSRGDTSEVIEERDGGQAINPVSIYIPDNGRDGDDDTDE